MHYQVLIIGSGFSGICLGIKLLEAGITQFKILEKADDLGGTWRENTYPGAECDVPSALYSYSFEHNADWNYKWSGQEQILKYQKDTAHKYGLDDFFEFSRTVEKMNFDESAGLWSVETAQGQTYKAQHVVSAVGQLHVPNTPRIKGSFDGVTFHSARWNHNFDVKGKRIAVVGNAASALQFIPEIAKSAADVYVLQRSPNWVLPKVDRPYAKWEQWLSDKVPAVTKLYRFSLWLRGEGAMFLAIRGNRFMQWVLRLWNQSYMKKSIASPELRAKLTPDYPVGAKRILFSDHYYQAIARDNVHLITDRLDSLYANGITLVSDNADSQQQIEVDAIIYGTGFVTNPFLSEIEVRGRKDQLLAEHWKGGAHAYLGLSTHGFPNLHFMYGPNTNLGHNSIIIMIEAQAKAITKLVKLERVEIDAGVEKAFNDEMQDRLANLTFSTVEDSWYLVEGRVTNNWAGRTTEYRRRVNKLDIGLYRT